MSHKTQSFLEGSGDREGEQAVEFEGTYRFDPASVADIRYLSILPPFRRLRDFQRYDHPVGSAQRRSDEEWILAYCVDLDIGKIWRVTDIDDVTDDADRNVLVQDQCLTDVSLGKPGRERSGRRRKFVENDSGHLDHVCVRLIEEPRPEGRNPVDGIILSMRVYQDVCIKEVKGHLPALRSSCSNGETDAGPTPRILAARVYETTSSCSARLTTSSSRAPSRWRRTT